MNLKTKAAALLSAGALVGTAGVIALQTHAQQAPVQPTVQVQNQATQTPDVTTGDKATPQDTDNIQDPGGVEKPDAPNTSEVKGTDANDNQAGDTDTTPDNGQGDQAETSATGTN